MLNQNPDAVHLPARGRWSRLGQRPLALLLVMLITVGSVVGAAARFQTAADESPASGDAQVIAHGVIAIPGSDLVWLIERLVAPPPAGAEPISAESGFLLGATGAMLVEDTPEGAQTRVAPGEAVLTTAGTEQVRAALGANAATYFAISLVAADAVASEETSLVFTSEPFAGMNGRHETDLVRDILAPAATTEVPGGSGPTLVFVTAGAADITTAAGEVVSLATDQAIALSGPLVVTGAPEGAVVQAVVIGAAMPRLTGPAAVAETSAPAATPAAVSSPVVGDESPAATPDSGEAPPPAAATPAADDGEEQAAETPTTEEPVAEEPAADDAAAADSDGDGLTDAAEAEINTDPSAVDTDGDGLTDGDEVNVYGTAPLAPDTDGDGFLDGDEIAQGTDPFLPGSYPGAPADSDGDGLPDSIEAELGTDPADTDTDDDGLTDGDEYYVYQTGTRNPDTDADGILDGDEINNGTDPNDPTSF